MANTFNLIYDIVRQIPKGRVCTYGGIALLAGNPRWSRVVGYAMGGCRDKTVPCHRVVHKDGSMSQAFNVGGENIQAQLLAEEGVIIKDDGKADVANCLWP